MIVIMPQRSLILLNAVFSRLTMSWIKDYVDSDMKRLEMKERRAEV
jgi:hypothetical protein